MTDTTSIRRTSIDANGVRFACLEAGEGPPVLLLHGFPDDAWTWSGQLTVLAQAGYRAVAPFMRGYPPTEVRPTDSKRNAEDAVALLRAVGGGEPAFVVGHDWGGLATYSAVALAPELVRRAVVEAVSHPATLLDVLKRPAVVHHLFHVWFFQLEDLSEDALRANDFALVDYLWQQWARPGHDDTAHVARLKREVLSQPGVVEALLHYYRVLVRVPREEPDFFRALVQPLATPLLNVWGALDPARAAADAQEPLFTGEYRIAQVPDAGHFVHREQPDAFDALLLGWLASEPAQAGRAAARAY